MSGDGRFNLSGQNVTSVMLKVIDEASLSIW